MRGRAVDDRVDHVAADPWIGVGGQLEQPRPHPVGITWEHQAHRYRKRAHGGRYLFRTPAAHLATIAATLIDG